MENELCVNDEHPLLGDPPLPGRTAIVRYRWQGECYTVQVKDPARTITSLGLQATWRWQAEEDGYRMWVRLTNRGKRSFELDTIDVLVAPLPNLGAPLETWAVYQNGWNSWSPTFARHVNGSTYTDPGTDAYRAAHQPHWQPGDETVICSQWGTVIAAGHSDTRRGWALLAGFVTARDQLSEVRVRPAEGELIARCYLDGAVLPPGGALSSETLVLRAGPDPLALLEEWAALLGQEMVARIPPAPPTGWCSWYYYYGQNSARDVLQNVAAIDRHALPLDVILLDDGYQAAIGDWFAVDRRKFPDGMEAVAEAVRGAGHRLGIWTAPFGAAVDSRLAAAHPDWLLRDEAGAPVIGWHHIDSDCYALDCTHPEVLEWLEESFGRMRREWGVEFFKVDFLFAAARPGRRHDPAATRAQALRRGLEAIRAAIGDAFLLGCGAPLMPCVGLVDGMRVGPDIDPNWQPMWRHDLSMPAAENALRNAIARAPFHGRLWANDPDCLLVRQREEKMELVLNEMRTLAALTALLGGLTFNSDDLAAIRPGRLKYLRQALPPTGHSARPVDLFENEMPRLLVLPVAREWGQWWVAGVVNWEDSTAETTVRLAELGLPPGRYHVYHYWRRCYLGVVDDAVVIRRHQPHETAVLVFKPVSNRPDLLLTTFHVCQSPVITGVQSKLQASELGLWTTLKKRGQQFGEVLFTVPGQWQATKALVDGVKRPLVQVAPRVIGLGLTLEGQAEIEMTFSKT
ncbi:MAG: alpha-galactosidase [Anaerolineae bacterium]|nr:alpha-galactosidase [Anaerolineae bacterium]